MRPLHCGGIDMFVRGEKEVGSVKKLHIVLKEEFGNEDV